MVSVGAMGTGCSVGAFGLCRCGCDGDGRNWGDGMSHLFIPDPAMLGGKSARLE